jgi:MFS family permease
MTPLKLFRSATFSGVNALTLLLYSAFGAAFFLLPFELIRAHGYSPTQAGAALLPMSVGLAVLSPIAGRVASRIGARPMLIVGPLVVAAGFGLLAALAGARSYWTGVFPGLTVLALGVLAVFAVLVAQFRSGRAALLVLLTVPPALAGGLLFLAVARVPLNVSSLMGLVLLVGLVVKNGILLVEVTLDRLEAGLPLPAALRRAGKRRLRPILMTTLCTIFGLLPLAFSLGAGSELQRPLAVAVIGGLLFSTAATLFALPALAELFLRGHVARGAEARAS